MNPFTMLPEGCISEIISFTTPVDTIRSSVISRGFKAAAESDIVWDKFLPSDHQNIVSRSVSPILFDNKEDLYFRLSESPILLDEGKMSFWLDKTNGKKCYLLSSRQLTISFSDTELFWEHTFDADSRYPRQDWNSRYHGLELTNAMVRFVSQENEDEAEERATIVILAARAPRNLKGKLPEKRTDGWLEVEIGKFYNGESGDDNGDVEARLLDSRPFHAKVGLIIEGIEFRPI
ncbi:F-box protein PP2-B1-like isoform X2 [Solanum tuberosum]|uniref:F-box family protein n=1 Tax=Solanum tuberosum TaxID=4113 RepID=M1CWD2_SOLTU|nr:PREDICTED: F-box protein PP2-B1-like isoform X2 [Solanum tuberosum]